MKSIQFNYFASDDDMLSVARILHEWQPKLVMLPSRGSQIALKGVQIHEASELIPRSPGEMHLLCTISDSERVLTTAVTPDISCIVVKENPVVEYSPSAPVDRETVKIGRLYAAYNDAAFMKQVRNLFSRLQHASEKMDDAELWIFPNAIKAEKLRPWGGKDWDNPYLA